MPARQRNRAGLSFVVVPSTEPIGPALAHRAGVTAASLGATPPPHGSFSRSWRRGARSCTWPEQAGVSVPGTRWPACRPPAAPAVRAGSRALTHSEVGGLQRRAGEQPGEDHVYGDREAPTHVPIGDLNILDLCGIAGVPFCTAWGRGSASVARKGRRPNAPISTRSGAQDLHPLTRPLLPSAPRGSREPPALPTSLSSNTFSGRRGPHRTSPRGPAAARCF